VKPKLCHFKIILPQKGVCVCVRVCVCVCVCVRIAALASGAGCSNKSLVPQSTTPPVTMFVYLTTKAICEHDNNNNDNNNNNRLRAGWNALVTLCSCFVGRRWNLTRQQKADEKTLKSFSSSSRQRLDVTSHFYCSA